MGQIKMNYMEHTAINFMELITVNFMEQTAIFFIIFIPLFTLNDMEQIAKKINRTFQYILWNSLRLTKSST